MAPFSVAIDGKRHLLKEDGGGESGIPVTRSLTREVQWNGFLGKACQEPRGEKYTN